MKKKPLLIVLGILLAVVVGVGVYFVIQSNSTPYVDPSVIDITEVNSSEEVLCPLETKICPDGNIVVRDSTNGCEFYDCPVDETNTSAATDDSSTTVCTLEVKMCADGTEVGKEASRNCQFKLCPDGTQLK